MLAALLAGLGLVASPAWAADADLAALSRDGRQGAIGTTVSVPLGIANHGPAAIKDVGPVTLSYRAPAGTVIALVPGGATNCRFNGDRTSAQCQLNTEWRAGIGLQPKGSYRDLRLRIVTKVTGPGAFEVTCGCDTKKANNATNIVVNGVTKPVPSASPKPSSKPSASASPSASPSATPSETPATTDEPVATESADPVVAEPTEPESSGDATLSGMMLIGFGVVLLGLVGLGGAVYLWRVRAGRDEDGGDGDMDATQVIR
ncbi:hypothetical protein [Catellatospora sichuanensis]|uniref:hypothetical protein n=1 Tax=Catellatospora sichuanensis TaxID=1969805 RepID=UPI001181DD87|nr:hypothetical protein [Catellatospora sichuanensis]